jgi:hypothetical protein
MEFEVGETVITRITVLDYLTDAPVDPDTITITITLDGEKKVDDKDMISEGATGKYYYDYVSDSKGWHDVVVEAERVGRISKESTGFIVR